jgi:hypothetical protein
LPGVFGKEPEAIQVRLEYWTATWAMILDHPWLGVGPGNFARHYASYLSLVPHASEVIRDPHQFALELWATTGVFGLAALFFALGAYIAKSVRYIRMSRNSGEEIASTDGVESPVWVFYAGGGAGLLLSIVFSGDFDPVVIGLHVLVWFASFWVFQHVLPTGDWLAAACLAGVAAVLLNLLVSGGIGSPAVAQPLWAVIGLGLASMPARSRSLPYLPLRLIPLAIAFSLAVGYLHGVLRPVVVAQSHSARAAELKRTPPSSSRNRQVADHLQAARAASPRDSRVLMELAIWQWEYGEGATWRDRAPPALALLEEARRLDPRNHQLAAHLFQADLQSARLVDEDRKEQIARPKKESENKSVQQAIAALELERQAYLDQAEAKIGEVVRLNPAMKAWAHFEMAEMLAALGDSRARSHAQAAWQTHQDARSRLYRLTPGQLQQVERWRGP